MHRVGPSMLVAAVILSLLVGGIIGFVMGNRSVEKKNQSPVAASPIPEAEKNKQMPTEEITNRGMIDWKVIKTMIGSGISSNDSYFVQEVQLQHVQITGTKVFYVLNKQMHALIGLKGVLAMYYPELETLDYDPKHLKSTLESRQYKAGSTEELLALASEVVPLMYGCCPVEHKLVNESDVVGSGRLPMTKDTILGYESRGGLFVNYYATLGPWKDTVNVTVVLHGQHLSVSISPIDVVPRGYE